MISVTTVGYALLAAAPVVFGWQNRATIASWLQSRTPKPEVVASDEHEICHVLSQGRQWSGRDPAVAAQFFDTARLIIKRIEEDAKGAEQ